MSSLMATTLQGALMVTTLLFSGCASLNTSTPRNTEQTKIGEKTQTIDDTASKHKSIAGSELEGIFKKSPITDTRKPERFPRVAITIKSATPGVFASNAIQNTLRDTDCVTFDIRLWNTVKDGRSYNDLVMCAREMYPKIKGTPMYQIPTWGRRSYWPGDKNSGAVRTDGPTPPGTLFPSAAQFQRAWLDGLTNAKFFIGAMLVDLGYDWNDVNDRRIWFVSVPTQ